MLNLSEHLKNLKSDMEVGTVKSWLSRYPYLDLFEVKTIPGRTISWRREETLGSVSRRSINETWVESTGTDSVQSAALEIIGGTIDIDRELLDEDVYDDEAANQMSKKARALGYTAASDIINGDPGADIEQFAGLKVLTAELPSRQTVDAASIDLSTPTARGTNIAEALRFIRIAVQRVRAGTGYYPAFGLLNDTLEQALVDGITRAGLLRVTDDTIDRRMATGEPWNLYGIPMYDAGYMQDQSSKIISDNSDGTGLTSVYFVYSSMNHTRLIQKYAPRTETIGNLENGVHRRWLHYWAFGLQVKDKFSVSRGKNFKVA
ncbi:MAG TPA: hypothetical protein VKQ32_21250 [Polyangia bacterium]|nr:hypothetical protein [Polyangia bacterium]